MEKQSLIYQLKENFGRLKSNLQTWFVDRKKILTPRINKTIKFLDKKTGGNLSVLFKSVFKFTKKIGKLLRPMFKDYKKVYKNFVSKVNRFEKKLRSFDQKIYSIVQALLKPILSKINKFFQPILAWLWKFSSPVLQPVLKFLLKIIKNRLARAKYNLKRLKNLLKQIYQQFYKSIFAAKEGRLSWFLLFKLSIKNLIYSTSRTGVTTAAISLGTAAIVFLVSFAYGLQEIVTNRLVYPNATKVADVQSSSTALSLDRENIDTIKQVSGIKDVAPAINAAGILQYNNSKIDVVVVGAQNAFLEYTNLLPSVGDFFSEEANLTYQLEDNQLQDLQELISQKQAGDVLGVENENEISFGELIDNTTIRFRVKDDVYLPVRQSPDPESKIIGYVKGSILESYAGQQVWGDSYQSVNTAGRAYQTNDGIWYGKWLKAKLPLYEEKAATVYIPQTKDNGSQLKAEGYLPQVDVHILSPEEVVVERQLQQTLTSTDAAGLVLGEATAEAELSAQESLNERIERIAQADIEVETVNFDSTASAETSQSANLVSIVNEDSDATVAASLNELVENQQTKKEEDLQIKLATVEVKKQGGKEVLLSSGLLKAWEINAEDIIGQDISLEYLLSGGVISGLSGRVLSQAVNYKVVGVIDDSRSIVFAPLGDLQSMGADRYSSLKVLVDNQQALKSAREHIEALGFITQSLVDTLAQVNKLFMVMRFLLGLFGMIALVVAVFGMFNTLTISLLERTREIGVMKTLGTTDKDVLKMFMVESLLIGILGGIMGVLVGIIGGKSIDFVFGLFRDAGQINLFRTPLSFIFFVFILSIVVGLLTGIYPARRARKISALDALRYE